MNDKIKIIALFGESGAGKDTVKQAILKDNPKVKEIISYTTRPKRDCEIDGKDYYFITEKGFDFRERQGMMIETSCFNDWHYGTAIGELSDTLINVGVFNIQSIKQLRADSRLLTLPVYVSADPEVRFERVLTREKNPDYREIYRRFFADPEDFTNVPFSYVTIENNMPMTAEHQELIQSFLITHCFINQAAPSCLG